MKRKVKINKKIFSLVLVIICTMNLTVCQLAKTESQYKETEDLCGVFITYHKDGEDSAFEDEDKKYYGNFGAKILDKDIDKYKFGDLKGYVLFLHAEGKGENKEKNTIL